MGCDVIHTWTFCSLVGAFLDLVLAYLVLCGSATAYFTAKFLGIFGLSLPCPCNGFFGDPSSENECRCVQRVLIEFPARRISSVQMSVQRKFPFDKIWLSGSGKPSVKLLVDNQIHDGFAEMHSMDQCGSMVESICSFSEVQRANNLDRNDEYSSSEQDADKFAIQCQNGGNPKGKAVWYQKSRRGLHRRRKVVSEYGRTWSTTSEAHLKLGGKEYSTCNSEHERESSGQSFPSRHSWKGRPERFVEFPHGEERVERAFSDSDSKGVSMDGVPNGKRKLGENGAVSIKALEEALEEEYAVRSALYLELEKERNAAASAADEAMAMISRLQEEKAGIEMEARQYQRMIEEKAAYDAEEMNILKEILLRREREKLVLEKEAEVYREMLFNGKTYLSEEEGHYDREKTPDQGVVSFDMNEDPGFLLQQISASVAKKRLPKDLKRIPDTDFGALLEAESNFKELIENARNESFVRLMDVCGSSEQSLPSTENRVCGFESDHKQSQSAKGSVEKIEMHDERTLLSAARLMDVCGSSNQASPSSDNGLCRIQSDNKQSQSAEGSAVTIEMQFEEKTVLPAARLTDVCGSPTRASSFCRVESDNEQSQSEEGSSEKIEMQIEEKTVLSAADMNSQACPQVLQDSTLSNQFRHPSEDLQQSSSSFHSGSKQKENKGVTVNSDGMPERDRSSYGSKKEKNTWYDDQHGNHVDIVNNHANDSMNYQIDPESGIYDVHVVDDNIRLGNAGSGQRSGILSAKAIVRNSLAFEASSSDPSNLSKYQQGPSTIRSSSDIDIELRAWDDLRERAPYFDLRRHSIPLVDNEKLRLNNEVGWLTERLKTVQEGRERLNISMEHKEKEKIHLLLLEEIAQQLREIHQLTEPGKAERQGSLPPPSSKTYKKVSSKKRRCRSVSRGVNEST